MKRRLITSESITEGHPDKVCDRISDSVLDAMIAQDPTSRVACETCVTSDYALVFGEVTTKAKVNIEAVVRRAITEIGYTQSGIGFDAESCKVEVRLGVQSPDIALGVDNSIEVKDATTPSSDLDKIGAGDQGMMYGYACRETDTLMPMPIYLAHKLTRRLTEVRKQGILPYLKPDGKSQVTVVYENGKPVRVDTVVVSTQHDEGIDNQQIYTDILKHVIQHEIDAKLLTPDTIYYINPTGKFVVGGPAGDSGLTGRKIIADTYGGICPHGGGAFSGKDPTKVDRSAAYMARYVCKNVVAAGLADRCELQVSYAIGVSKPVSIYVDTFGTGKLSDEKLTEIVSKEFDFRPRAIIQTLNLLRPIYTKTSSYGHFGQNDFPWEKTDRIDSLKKYV